MKTQRPPRTPKRTWIRKLMKRRSRFGHSRKNRSHKNPSRKNPSHKQSRKNPSHKNPSHKQSRTWSLKFKQWTHQQHRNEKQHQ